MRGNGKMFISHTHLDNERCDALLPALDAWGVDYWFDLEQLGPGQHLSERIQQAITERSIFLRICTANTTSSFWMPLELNAFRGLQLGDQEQRRRRGRISVNLILDAGYKSNPAYMNDVAERADAVIDATNRLQADWLAELRTILDLARAPRARMSRRTVLGVGAAAVVSVAAIGGAGAIYEARLHAAQTPPPYPKPSTIPFDNPQTLDPRLKWFFAAGDDGAGVTLAGDVLYAITNDGCYALKAADGSIIWWNPKIKGDHSSPPQPDGTRVYLNDGNGIIYALDSTAGTEVWSAPSGSVYSSRPMALANGVLYALDDNGFVNALNSATGAVLWQSPSVGKDALDHSAPTYANGMIFVGSPDGNLYALNAADGTLAWQHLTGGKIQATPTVANGLVYFGSEDQKVYALHAADGSVAWTYAYTFQIDNAPVVAGNAVYIGLGQYLYAFDALAGTVLWKAPAGTADASGYVAGGNDIFSDAVVAGDLVYVTSGATLFAFSITQKQVAWSFKTHGGDYDTVGHPAVANGIIYYPGSDDLIYALSAS